MKNQDLIKKCRIDQALISANRISQRIAGMITGIIP